MFNDEFLFHGRTWRKTDAGLYMSVKDIFIPCERNPTRKHMALEVGVIREDQLPYVMMLMKDQSGQA